MFALVYHHPDGDRYLLVYDPIVICPDYAGLVNTGVC
jgi:hypothetical protein